MAAKSAALKPSTRHELVTKAIFERLLTLDNIQNLTIKHDVCIRGLTACHQIDVYWEFRAGGIDHKVIVEVRKKGRRTQQSELFAFSTVLSDIPGQPRGIFVSQNGYQSIRVALKSLPWPRV